MKIAMIELPNDWQRGCCRECPFNVEPDCEVINDYCQMGYLSGSECGLKVSEEKWMNLKENYNNVFL